MKTNLFFNINNRLGRLILLFLLILFISASTFAQNVYFLRDHNPWGSISNVQAMNAVFGIGNWTASNYTISASTVFSNSTHLVYMEGGENNDTYMKAFLEANRALIETWVFNGGRLFLNSAGWNTGMNYGFGDVILNYSNSSTFSLNVSAADLTHPIFNGPYNPVGTTFSGNWYSHDYITGSGLTNIMLGTAGGNAPVLASKNWGSGLVLFGGITAPSFHQPQPNAQNVFQNYLAFLNNHESCPPSFGMTNTVSHVTCPGGSDGSINLSVNGGVGPYIFNWSNGATVEDLSSLPSGTYSVEVTDANGCKDDISIIVNDGIDNIAPVITTNGNKTLENDANKCGAAVEVSASATDNCSVGTPAGIRDDEKALTDDYPVGTTTITWNVTDANGNPATAVTQTVTVTNVTSVINTVTAPIDPVAINTSINLNVNYSDNNVTNAAINWGDGTAVQNVSAPANSFTTPHTYAAAGVYRIKVTLTDACNVNSSEFIYEYVVVYDPSAGFVTGGGWINSPAGAYTVDPSLIGKANFGFVSKYQKGATVPTGNTEFQFHAGGLNFKSSIYEWLVVSGTKAQFKGSGTVNGTGDYGFLLSSVDGNLTSPISADKFRIKIWDRSTNAVVYDNQLGASDDAVASTDIAGGSIVIHVPKGNKTATAGQVIMNPEKDQIYEGQLSVKVLPNPSKTYFTLFMASKNNQSVSLRMIDGLGRAVEAKSGVPANGSLKIGHNYRPGIYYAEFVQGGERITVKLVKLP